MGRFLNPGRQMFQRALNSEIYVDKSGIIAGLNRLVETEQCCVCVSRPRRFGKTMTGNMLASYYGFGADSREQFEQLAISADPSFDRYLNRYDVIQLNIRDFMTEAKAMDEMLEFVTEDVVGELRKAYPDAMPRRARNLSNVLSEVFAATNRAFVFIIDEWDAVFRVHQHDETDQTTYLDWLRNLLKDKPYVALAYMTGILPIKKYGEHSALNMFTEISMIDAWPFDEYTGFTDDEVMHLCERYGRSIEEMRRWYDGYAVGGEAIYNPRSAVMSAMSGRYSNYWTQTEAFEALRVYVDMDMDGLHEKVVRLVAGESLPIDTTAFVNDMTTFSSADDVLTLLVHLGYLTYDAAAGTVRVPNLEVMQQFGTVLRDSGWTEVARSVRVSDELMRATLAGNTAKVAALVETAHEDACSILKYNDENSLACAISLAYYAARRSHVVVREMPAGKGFADLVFLPRKGSGDPAMIVELKARGITAETALTQARERRYARLADGLAHEVFLVGISYDPKSKKHECAIERLES